jgi:hypothetical protein
MLELERQAHMREMPQHGQSLLAAKDRDPAL